MPKIEWFYYNRQNQKLESKLELIMPKAQTRVPQKGQDPANTTRKDRLADYFAAKKSTWSRTNQNQRMSDRGTAIAQRPTGRLVEEF